MKKYLSLILAMAMLSLSACDILEVESETSNDLETSSLASSDESSLLSEDLPVNDAWAQDSTFSLNDELPWQAYPENSDEWYVAKYIKPYMNGFGLAFGEPQELDGLNFFIPTLNLVENYIDIDDYYDSSLSSYRFPREMIQETKKTFFNFEDTRYDKSGHYNSDLDAFLTNGWSFTSSNSYTLVDAQVDGSNIILQVDVYKDENKEIFGDSLVFTIRDNGNTFEYISVLFKNGKPNLLFSDIISSDFEPLSDEWILSELVFPVENALHAVSIINQASSEFSTEAIDFFVKYKFIKGCRDNRSFREGDYLMRPYFDLDIGMWVVPKDIYEDIVAYYFGENFDLKDAESFDEERQSYTLEDYLIDGIRGEFTIKRFIIDDSNIAVDLYFTRIDEDSTSENNDEPQHIRTFILQQIDNRYILQDVISPEASTPSN